MARFLIPRAPGRAAESWRFRFFGFTAWKGCANRVICDTKQPNGFFPVATDPISGVSLPVSTTLVHRLTSALLAATYLVVGATGEGLFYLIEAPEVAQATDGDAGHGFAHDHGDGLWHHHGGHHDENATASTRSRVGEGLSDRDGAGHHDHSTLLLAVASAIELSLLNSPRLSETPRAALMIGSGEVDFTRPTDRGPLGPRGPPLGDCV